MGFLSWLSTSDFSEECLKDKVSQWGAMIETPKLRIALVGLTSPLWASTSSARSGEKDGPVDARNSTFRLCLTKLVLLELMDLNFGPRRLNIEC